MTLFGRLDIVFPDEQQASHQLSGHDITIGSSPTCAITLSHKSVADLHCRIAVAGDGVYIIDLESQAGTFVDDQRLPANSPTLLADTSAIAIGELRLIFYKQSDSPTAVMPAFHEQTQPALASFHAHLETSQPTVFPASSVTVPLRVANTSHNDAEFRVEFIGLPDGWVKPESLTFPLPAHEETELRFLIKPERRADIAPQHFPLDVNITRLGGRQPVLRLTAVIEVGGFGGLSLALEPAQIHLQQQFILYLLNQGNEPLKLKLDCVDTNNRLDLRLEQSDVTLPPGGRAQLAGNVRPRHRPLVGNARDLPFVLVAKAENPAGYRVALPASVHVRPRVPSRVAALLLIIAIAAAALVALVIYEPPRPEIASMSLSAAQVAQGTPVQLNWRAENAEQFVIEVDRRPVAELPADASSYKLNTDEFTDPINIALIARRADLTDIETASLAIYQPVRITQFNADRTSMFRRVVGALTIRWSVEGATSLHLSPPAGFEVVSESRVANSSGELALRGVPTADFEVLLSAIDEVDNTTVHALQIAVRDPECSPSSDTMLYAGPDPRYAPLSVAVAHVPVLIRGANATSDWLQIEMASGQVGWGEFSRFFCQGFAPEALELVSDIPPLPTTMPTATPTQTSAPTATPTPSPTTEPTTTPTTQAAP